MDAYKLLGVEYSADPSELRRAYKRLVRLNHPDRFPSGSAEQQEATAGMAAINGAYALVREAPLRHHRVSRAASPDTAWTDDELEQAIQRARLDRKVDIGISVALAFVAVVLVPFLVRMLPSAAYANPMTAPLVMVIMMGASMLMWSLLGPQMWRTMYKLQLALMILRFLTHGVHGPASILRGTGIF